MSAPVPSPAPTAEQEHTWMGLALRAARAAGAAGDVPIGAALVAGDGTVLAVVGNEREQHHDPTAHAEVLALRRGAELRAAAGAGDGWRLTDCTLVVTLEPCPMCAGALLLARIPRVVFGAWDPKAGACGSVLDVVRDPRFNHRVQVRAGVRSEESAALLREFFAAQRD
ncbi:nucleoside deaminase [Micrococcus yunnanensis]|uniref:nucleoside deaminase n=1 Tax=Micrococcus TaxID=1269 RepID=UPI001072EC24|nr:MULTISPECIES: nucleoside deaminase [Micrococcus]MBF0745763.1 nucleoside deaminase [Micrococcus yunnanensis]MCV7562815.1 nucleoside deaminase [Micrococcus luteus]MCV7705301.1 nucleoside deaminase [Micrococcus luteus]TFU53956.1 nucleoside deaminase [Micrococcus yunnanensis]